MKDLIERLRIVGGIGDDAADFVEQQAAEIEVLQAKLSAMEAKTPVVYRKWSSRRHEWEYDPLCTLDSEPLYTAPKVALVEQYEIAMSPRRWNQEMNDAWNLNIPDLQAAFDALRQAAIGGQQP